MSPTTRSKSRVNKPELLDLPNEVLLMIFNHLDAKDIHLSCAMTCQRLSDLIAAHFQVIPFISVKNLVQMKKLVQYCVKHKPSVVRFLINDFYVEMEVRDPDFREIFDLIPTVTHLDLYADEYCMAMAGDWPFETEIVMKQYLPKLKNLKALWMYDFSDHLTSVLPLLPSLQSLSCIRFNVCSDTKRIRSSIDSLNVKELIIKDPRALPFEFPPSEAYCSQCGDCTGFQGFTDFLQFHFPKVNNINNFFKIPIGIVCCMF